MWWNFVGIFTARRGGVVKRNCVKLESTYRAVLAIIRYTGWSGSKAIFRNVSRIDVRSRFPPHATNFLCAFFPHRLRELEIFVVALRTLAKSDLSLYLDGNLAGRRFISPFLQAYLLQSGTRVCVCVSTSKGRYASNIGEGKGEFARVDPFCRCCIHRCHYSPFLRFHVKSEPSILPRTRCHNRHCAGVCLVRALTQLCKCLQCERGVSFKYVRSGELWCV